MPKYPAMIKAFQNAKLIVFALFLVVTAGMWAYEILYALPKERCEKAGAWWAPKYRACGVPLDVSSFTGRAHPAQATTQTSAPVAR
jgi:hypothetical protein